MSNQNTFAATTHRFASRLARTISVRTLVSAVIAELSYRCSVAATTPNFNNDVDLYIHDTNPDHPIEARGRFARCQITHVLSGRGIDFLSRAVKKALRAKLMRDKTGRIVTITLKQVLHRKKLFPKETTAEIFNTPYGVFLIETGEDGFSVLKKIERKTSA